MFLGPEGSAIDLEYLRSNRIDRIVMAAEHVEKRFPDASDGIEYIYLKIDDSPTEDIKRYFETVIDFIVKSKDTNVLVHCVSGISRSGACVIAYLMKT